MNKAVLVIIATALVSTAIVGAFVGLIVWIDHMVTKRKSRKGEEHEQSSDNC